MYTLWTTLRRWRAFRRSRRQLRKTYKLYMAQILTLNDVRKSQGLPPL